MVYISQKLNPFFKTSGIAQLARRLAADRNIPARDLLDQTGVFAN